MHSARKFFLVATIFLLVVSADAQRLDDKLATSTNFTFTGASLSPEGQKYYLDQRDLRHKLRSGLFNRIIDNTVLDLEAKALNTTPDKLLAPERAKAPRPTAAEIQKIYDANAAALGGRPLTEVRDQIVEYLERDAQQRSINAYLERLLTKYKFAAGKDINAFGLTPTDVIATIGGRTITVADFNQANRIPLNDLDVSIYENLRAELDSSILTVLVAEEAKARNVDTGAFIAAEITDKLKTFTDEERATVENALKDRLFAKYNVKILLPEPERIVQNILVDPDDPQTGSPTSPVTVVMFSDFQCPACSHTHPILTQVIGTYAGKVRFVVRDYPLESLHKNAFQAALAANAARMQGKFFEYADMLYKNQDALDKASLIKYAAELGLNAKQFELDFSDAKTAAEIRKDQADGRTYGVEGTPTIFVNGVKVQRLTAEAFRRAIDRALSK